MLQQQDTKTVKYYYIDFLMNTHSSLHSPSPTPFFEDENEISTELGGGSNFFLKDVYGKSKEGRQKKCKGHREV